MILTLCVVVLIEYVIIRTENDIGRPTVI